MTLFHFWNFLVKYKGLIKNRRDISHINKRKNNSIYQWFNFWFLFMKIANPSKDINVDIVLYKADKFAPKFAHNKPTTRLANRKEKPTTK